MSGSFRWVDKHALMVRKHQLEDTLQVLRENDEGAIVDELRDIAWLLGEEPSDDW